MKITKKFVKKLPELKIKDLLKKKGVKYIFEHLKGDTISFVPTVVDVNKKVWGIVIGKKGKIYKIDSQAFLDELKKIAEKRQPEKTAVPEQVKLAGIILHLLQLLKEYNTIIQTRNISPEMLVELDKSVSARLVEIQSDFERYLIDFNIDKDEISAWGTGLTFPIDPENSTETEESDSRVTPITKTE